MKKEKIRYTFSLVTQGETKFYSLTMPSDILAECSFVTTREEDPKQGFQRMLDQSRAQAIADYIDAGVGTIPGSIVVSAQPEAELKVVGQGRSLEFKMSPKAFMVLDGQHRVYGFSLANKKLRVPVIIYNNLSRAEEARLFMDINTKQKPVPNPLLLDIKALAEAEEGNDALMREIFDIFHDRTDSVLYGFTSPSAAKAGKINRSTFNIAIKNAIDVFRERNAEKIFSNLNNYLIAVKSGLVELGLDETVMINSVIFRAIMAFYPVVARRVHSKHGADHSSDKYQDILHQMWPSIKISKLKKPGNSYKSISEMFESALDDNFQI